MIPVIIIPGLMGSEIKTITDNTTLWPWPTVGVLMRLALDKNGNQSDANRAIATDLIRTAAGRPIYETAFDFFTSKGYSEGNNLFGFPYDWRMDIRKTARNLAGKIEEAKSNAASKKVILVAHSMGGLVAAQYLVREQGDTDNIRALFMVGAPLLGAPKAFLSLRYGKESPFPSIIGVTPTDEEYRDIVSNMPGPYQLLPSLRFEAANGEGYVKKDGKMLTIGETYDQLDDAKFNRPMAESALEFHQDIDKKIAILNGKSRLILGTDRNTVKKIKVSGAKLETEITDQGDGTMLTLGLRDYLDPEDTKVFHGVEHLDLIRTQEVLHYIFGEMRSQLHFGDTINLRSPKWGRFLANPSGAALSLATPPKEHEEWKLVDPDDHGSTDTIGYHDKFALKSPSSGKFLAAGASGSVELSDHADNAATWKLVDAKDRDSTEAVQSFDAVFIKSHAKERFLSAAGSAGPLQLSDDHGQKEEWTAIFTK